MPAGCLIVDRRALDGDEHEYIADCAEMMPGAFGNQYTISPLDRVFTVIDRNNAGAFRYWCYEDSRVLPSSSQCNELGE